MVEGGGVPEDVLEVAEMQTIISLVAGGFGVSLVPASVGSVDRSGVTFRPIAGPTPTIELSAAWRSGAGSPVRDAFLALARAAHSPAAARARRASGDGSG
jgi:DNA-binding transcriptional LysR family regulator